MKKILLIITLGLLSLVLIGCENAHIKSQFKVNSYWISEDARLNIIFKGPILNKAYGSILINEVETNVIYELSEYSDKMMVYDETTLNTETPLLIFDLKVVIENKKFVFDKVTALVSLNNSNDELYSEYKVLIERTDIPSDEVFAKDFIGINYFSSTYGMRITYDDILFFNRESKILINDRPKNIEGIFKFNDHKTFDIYQNGVLILTGIYEFKENQLILSFGSNDLYHDTNEIILDIYK